MYWCVNALIVSKCWCVDDWVDVFYWLMSMIVLMCPAGCFIMLPDKFKSVIGSFQARGDGSVRDDGRSKLRAMRWKIDNEFASEQRQTCAHEFVAKLFSLEQQNDTTTCTVQSVLGVAIWAFANKRIAWDFAESGPAIRTFKLTNVGERTWRIEQ